MRQLISRYSLCNIASRCGGSSGVWIAYNGQETDKISEENAYKKGMKYFMLAAACIPHPSAYEAMRYLGIMYEHGNGVAADLKQALFYYEQSAKGGYTKSYSSCGNLHYTFYLEHLEKTKSIHLEHLTTAETWLNKAAELEYIQREDPVLNECWLKLEQVYTMFAAQNQQCAQAYRNKLNQIHTGQMAAQSEQDVVTPVVLVNSGSEKEEERSTQETMTPAVDFVVLANSGSEKGKEEEKKGEVVLQPDNSAARALTGGAGTFKRGTKGRNAVNETSSPNTDSKSDGWATVGRGHRQGRGQG